MAERPIDAEVFEEKLEDFSVNEMKAVFDNPHDLMVARHAISEVEWILENMPTIEAKPVVHAHWEEQNDETHFCSRCGNDATYTFEGKELVGFLCPFCGVQMDKVVE